MTNKTKSTVIYLFTILLLFSYTGSAYANPPEKSGNGPWFVSGRTGAAWLMKEISSDFIFLDNEFANQAGLALDIGVSRTLGRSWEPGILMSLFRLSGETELPEFSANGLHPSFIALYQAPVQYTTVSTSISAYCRYHFRDLSRRTTTTVRLDPYVELGAGVNYFFTQVAYKTTPPGENSAVIFRKGTGEKPRPGPGNVSQISLGLGTKIEMPRNLTLVFSLISDIINYDCLDAVHNYTDGERNHAKSVVPRIMAGVCVPIGGKSRSGGGDSYLPWGR